MVAQGDPVTDTNAWAGGCLHPPARFRYSNTRGGDSELDRDLAEQRLAFVFAAVVQQIGIEPVVNKKTTHNGIFMMHAHRVVADGIQSQGITDFSESMRTGGFPYPALIRP